MCIITTTQNQHTINISNNIFCSKHIQNLNIQKNTILSVFLSKNITKIDIGAFQNCRNLQEINLDNIEYIDDYAFNNCVKLKKIKFSKNIKYIGHSVFDTCISLINIDLSNANKLTILKNNTFEMCISLTYVNICNIIHIGRSCFTSCKNLKTVIFSKNITHIDDSAFNNCINLASFPTIHTFFIGYLAFNNTLVSNSYNELSSKYYQTQLNDNLSSFYISLINKEKYEIYQKPEYKQYNINIINKKYTGCYNNDMSLSSVYIDCEYINDFAFHNCVNLKNVILTPSVKYIGKYAFASCVSLISINLQNVQIIKKYAFKNCLSLTVCNLSLSNKFISTGVFETCISLKTINIQNTKYIGELAFKNCYNLEIIFAKNNLIVLNYAFTRCFKLNAICSIDKTILYNILYCDLAFYNSNKIVNNIKHFQNTKLITIIKNKLNI